MRGRLFPVTDDWYEWRQDEPRLAGTVLVRVGVGPGGRLVLTGLRIDGTPSAELLRAIPVGRIEAAANAQLVVGDAPDGMGEEAVRGTAAGDPDGARADGGPGDPDGGFPGIAVDGRAGSVAERAKTVLHLRAAPLAPPVAEDVGWEMVEPALAVVRAVAAGSARLRGRPDIFYRQVADVYLEFAQASPRPACDLADQHGVPVSTAHRWVKEARRRGFLPPGKPGKSG